MEGYIFYLVRGDSENPYLYILKELFKGNKELFKSLYI